MATKAKKKPAEPSLDEQLMAAAPPIPTAEEIGEIVTMVVDDKTQVAEVGSTEVAEPMPDHPSDYDAESQAQELEDDFGLARRKVREALITSADSMQELAELARTSAHPRAFEALTGLATAITTASKDLVELHEKRKKIQEGEPQGPTSETTNNNLFVGSTAELHAMLKKMRSGEAIGHD